MRNSILLGLSFVLAWVVTGCGTSDETAQIVTGSPARDAPNVILVISDALRADRLSLYGHDRRTSPHLEDLARDGVVFERAFSQAPWTPPSMASLMTGFYQSTHGVTHSRRAEGRHSLLDPRFTTLAELFRSVGYRTGAVSAQPWISAATGFDQGFEDFEVVSNIRDPYGNDKVMVGGLEWIDEHRDERFFLYLHAMDPHFPYEVPELFRFDDTGELPTFLADGVALEELEAWNAPADPPSAEELEHLFALYDAEIRYVDWWMGVLDRHLRHRGLREDTLIVFTSDHGEAFYEHGVYGHITTVFNEMLHIPLILSQPGLVSEPYREAAPVESVDVLPTLAKLVGFEVPAGAPGVDLLGGDLPGLAYSEGERLVSYKLQSAELSIIVGRELRRWAVYDLEADPGEQRSVADARAESAQELLRELRARRQRAVELAKDGAAETSLDEETRRQLEALGYTD